MRLIDADALRQVLEVFTEKDTLGHTPLQLCDAMPAAPRWHRVEELPKQNGAFAVACVYDCKLYWYKGIYLDGKWLREGDGIEMPADYWMPLPEPPKEDA